MWKQIAFLLTFHVDFKDAVCKIVNCWVSFGSHSVGGRPTYQPRRSVCSGQIIIKTIFFLYCDGAKMVKKKQKKKPPAIISWPTFAQIWPFLCCLLFHNALRDYFTDLLTSCTAAQLLFSVLCDGSHNMCCRPAAVMGFGLFLLDTE